jgi:hypothetical protein
MTPDTGWPHVVIFDSDSNPIAAYPWSEAGDTDELAQDTPLNIGCAILEHFALVDRTTRDNAELGIEAATDHLIVMRATLRPDDPFYGGPKS